MPNEDINPDDIAFKELGGLQEKVVFFLAENPQNHKQAILNGIEHPADQYGSISKAVDALKKLGYIESKKALSQKNVEIKKYECTELGVFYALARNPNADFLKVLDGYKSKVEFCKSLRALYDVWGPDNLAMFFRDMGEFLPMVRKHGVDFAVPYMLMKITKQMQSIDWKTRKNIVRAALKQFPHTRELLKEMRKNIDDVL